MQPIQSPSGHSEHHHRLSVADKSNEQAASRTWFVACVAACACEGRAVQRGRQQLTTATVLPGSWWQRIP